MGLSRPKFSERRHPLTCLRIPNLVRIGCVLLDLFRKDWFRAKKSIQYIRLSAYKYDENCVFHFFHVINTRQWPLWQKAGLPPDLLSRHITCFVNTTDDELSTCCDGRTLDNTCAAARSNIWTFFNIWNQNYLPREASGEDLKAATESAVHIVFCFNYDLILLSFRDMTTGGTTNGRRRQPTHILPLRRASNRSNSSISSAK